MSRYGTVPIKHSNWLHPGRISNNISKYRVEHGTISRILINSLFDRQFTRQIITPRSRPIPNCIISEVLSRTGGLSFINMNYTLCHIISSRCYYRGWSWAGRTLISNELLPGGQIPGRVSWIIKGKSWLLFPRSRGINLVISAGWSGNGVQQDHIESPVVSSNKSTNNFRIVVDHSIGPIS